MRAVSKTEIARIGRWSEAIFLQPASFHPALSKRALRRRILSKSHSLTQIMITGLAVK